jgi:hypothetical protein
MAGETAGVFTQQLETIDVNGDSCITFFDCTLTAPSSSCSLSPALQDLPTGGTVNFTTTFCNAGTVGATATTSVVTAPGGTVTGLTHPQNCGPTSGGFTYTAGTTPGSYTISVTTTDRNGRNCTATATVTIYATVTVCTLMNPAPQKYAVTMTGVTNSTCTQCTRVNRSYLLTNAGLCVWSQTITADGLCNPAQTRTVTLTFAGTVATLAFSTGAAIPGCPYTSSLPASFGASMTMTKGTPGAACTNWPATVTVSPVP